MPSGASDTAMHMDQCLATRPAELLSGAAPAQRAWLSRRLPAVLFPRQSHVIA